MALAWERWYSTVTPEEEEEEPPFPPLGGPEDEEEGAEVEGAPLELPASGLRRTGPVGSPEATVTAETAARRACCCCCVEGMDESLGGEKEGGEKRA